MKKKKSGENNNSTEESKAATKSKRLIMQIASVAVTVALIVGLTVADVICYQHEGEITAYLSPDTILFDESNLTEKFAESEQVVQDIAAEGITMLKNNGALPLDQKKDMEQRVNLFGVAATDLDTNGFYTWGIGSGTISKHKENIIFPKQAFTESGFTVNETLYNYFYEHGSNPRVDWWGSTSSKSVLDYSKGYSDIAVIFVSRFDGENINDQSVSTDTFFATYPAPWSMSYVDNDTDGRNMVQLSLKEEAMIKWCGENFAKTIVVINSGNVMELGYLDNDFVDAVLYCPYTGQSGARQIAEIFAGKTNPSGHTTDTFVYDTTKDPTWANAFMNASMGRQITYAEDIYVGYKWYETADHEGYFTKTGTSYDRVVWRPFGYGLSYTDFEWEVESVAKKEGGAVLERVRNGDTLEKKDTTLQVAVKVTNTGTVAGKEVVQLYVNPPYIKGGIEKPYLALAAFAKTDMLYPVAEETKDHPNSQTIILEFDLYDIASYDCYDKNANGKAVWELDGGQYTLSLRTDAHTLDDCTDAEFTFHIPAAGMAWDVDPVSGGTVENRFTGDKAEADTPIDGSREGNAPVVYLSRADFEGTFPKTETAPRTVGYDITYDNGTDAYIDDSEFYPEAKMPTFDSTETSYYLYTLEDGSKASYDDLQYTSGVKIVPNDELIMKLGADYNAPEWESLLDQVDKQGLIGQVTGCWHGTGANENIGKPRFILHDGPEGINYAYFAKDQYERVTGFPAEAMVGMTWNTEIARNEGAAMGAEIMGNAMVGIYAPAVDLHRHSYNGRNYEQYGEDPLICGALGAKVTYGMITQGAICSVKHFVCSQPGMNPNNYNTWLTEQNLRENYLKPFEMCVKEAGANHIMTSFNNIGGVRCAYSYALNNGVLRGEWGFKGSLITDYNVSNGSANRTAAYLVRAGNDQRFNANELSRSELNPDNVVDMYLARRSFKNSLYSFCNSYYRAKTYDPSYTVTDLKIIPGVNWWVPSLIVLEVLALAGCGYFLFIAFRRKKKK